MKKSNVICLFFVFIVFGNNSFGAQSLFKDLDPDPMPLGAPKKSDVCLSSRWPHPRTPDDPYETFAVAKSFHATRLEWVYTDDPEFIAKARRKGYRLMATLNATHPDIAPVEQYQQGRMYHPDGTMFCPPWMTWEPLNYMGCANTPQYINNVMARAIRIMDAGAEGLQFDDPAMNSHHSRYREVCFCGYCEKGFKEYLQENFSHTEQKELGIDNPGTFNYTQYRNTVPKKEQSAKLREVFVQYQDAITRNYHRRIHETLEKIYKREIPFSSNNSSISWHSPYDMFDYGMCELGQHASSPKYLYEKMRQTREMGKAQVLTFHNEDLALTRKLIGTCQALGANPLVPWDVWIKGAHRYYGTPEQYADLYGFIRANAPLLDGYVTVTGQGREVEADPLSPAALSDEDIFAVIRAKPDLSGPIVIHMVDWSDTPAPFTLSLQTSLLPRRPASFTLHTPAPWDACRHQQAADSGDYAPLTVNRSFPAQDNGSTINVNLPAIGPWAMLVLD